MTTYYCTSADIAAFMHLNDGDDFTEETVPRKSHVEAAINRVEDIIDEATKHAWRTVSVTNEYHDYLADWHNPRAYVRGRYPTHGVFLKHRAIKSFVSETHKIEIWNTDEWIDLVLTANGYMEGRDDDYWIDYESGVIYFVDEQPDVGKKTVRVTYDYGESTVPKDIKEWAIKLTAIDLLYSDDRSVFIMDGVDKLGLDPKVRAWKEDIEKIKDKREELIIA
jgi:hypothetical protein